MVKGMLVALTAATIAVAAFVVSAADEPKPAAEAKNLHTMVGQVVDLQRYLGYRNEGKNPTDAANLSAQVAPPAAERGTHVNVGGRYGVNVNVAKPPETLPFVKGFLVTDKTWLSKMTHGADLYVITCENTLQPAFNFNQYLGQNIKLTGRTFDHEGVRAFCVEKVEPVQTTPPPPPTEPPR